MLPFPVTSAALLQRFSVPASASLFICAPYDRIRLFHGVCRYSTFHGVSMRTRRYHTSRRNNRFSFALSCAPADFRVFLSRQTCRHDTHIAAIYLTLLHDRVVQELGVSVRDRIRSMIGDLSHSKGERSSPVARGSTFENTIFLGLGLGFRVYVLA